MTDYISIRNAVKCIKVDVLKAVTALFSVVCSIASRSVSSFFKRSMVSKSVSEGVISFYMFLKFGVAKLNEAKNPKNDSGHICKVGSVIVGFN